MGETAMTDTAAALVWSLTNVQLFRCTLRIGRRLFPDDDVPTSWLHAALLGVASVVTVITVFGALGLLYPPLVVGTVLAGATVGLRFLPPRADTESPLTAPGPSPDRIWLTLWAALFSFLLAHVGVSGLATFPTDVDSLTYHIPLIRYWLQAHNLYAPDGSHWSFPGNLEVVGLWMVCPFSGDFMLPLTNLPFVVVLAFGSVELARSFGLSRLLRHTVGIAAVSNFIVFRQLLDAENDVAFVPLFVACMAYGFRYLRHLRQNDLLLAAACAGLLCGVKYYAVGYAGVAWGAIICAVLVATGSVRAAARVSLYGAVELVLFAGYWYARNLVLTGSPFYPMGGGPLEDGGEAVPSGVWGTTLLGYGRADALPLYMRAVWDMLGPLAYVAACCSPVAAGWLMWTGIRAARTGDRVEGSGRCGVVAAWTGCVCLVLVTPFLVENIPGTQNQLRAAWSPARYSLCLLTLNIVMLAACAHDFGRCGIFRRRRLSVRVRVVSGTTGRSLRGVVTLAALPSAALALLGGVQLATVNRAEWLPIQPLDTFLLGANILCLGGLIRLVPMHERTRVGASCVLPVLVFVALAPVLSQRWHAGFARFYDAHYRTTAFTRLAAADPPTRCVCAVNLTEAYPFFGSRGSTRVVQPVRTGGPELLAEYMRARMFSTPT